MNKLIKERGSWLVLVILGLAAIFNVFYWGMRGDESQTLQHAEVKTLLEENKDLTQQVYVLEKQNKVDFMREFRKNRMLQEAYEQALKANRQQIVINKQEYEEKVIAIDRSPIDSVLDFLTKRLSESDSLGD